jgi:hypothetical protein
MIQQLAAEVQSLKAGEAIKKYTVDEQEKTKRTLGLIEIDAAEARLQLEQELGVIHKSTDHAHEAAQADLDRQHEAEQAQRTREASVETQAQDQLHQASQADQDRTAAAKAARSKVQ